MEEVKLNNLCSHYKDTFDIHRTTIKQRDKLFYGVLVVIALFTLQLSSRKVVADIVSDYTIKTTGIKLGNNIEFISTLLWLILLGFAIKYFQVVIEIERQYEYLYGLEKQINSFYSNSIAFSREGNFFQYKNTLFSNWIWSLYTLFFPSLILIIIIIKVKNQIITMNYIGINQGIDFLCYLIIGTSTILYIYKLHKTVLKNLNHKVLFKLEQVFRKKVNK